MKDLVQQQRFEIKYRINEEIASRVRDFIRGFLKPDEFSRGQNRAYPVFSLYLDSEDLKLYSSTINGDMNRFKLRLRYYEETETAPVFFEIKRRVNNTILKKRASVKREVVEALLLGEYPRLHHLTKPDGKQLVNLQEFMTQVRRIHAKPRTLVTYLREAWMSHADNSVRVTFDRGVHAAHESRAPWGADFADAVRVFEEHVIMEFKYTDRMPRWGAEMIQCFGLVQTGAAKYVEGVDLTGERRKLIPKFVDSRPPW